MNTKKFVTISLLAFVAVSVGYLILNNTSSAKTAESGTSTTISVAESLDKSSSQNDVPVTSNSGNKTLVKYFHGNTRCVTCRTIEALTREALETEFAKELQSGNLEFVTINLDDPENWHFVDDYQLVTRTVVIASLNNDKEVNWKRLDEVWNLVKDRDSFLNYVKNETKSLMEQNS